MPQTVRVTHPFFPLRGREFAFVHSKHCWRLDRVFCEGEDGRIRSLPTAWSDICSPHWTARPRAALDEALETHSDAEAAEVLNQARH